jgi:tripartite-type tricarboxylate transporter receptor subunit TctC
MVVFVSKASGITSMDKWFSAKNPVSFGGQAPGATFSDTVPRILRAALGLPVKPVSGYKGTTEVRLAIESGELDGNCLSWESGKATWAKAMETGDIIPLLQVVPKPIREIPNVPLAITYAKTDEARQLIELGVHQPPMFARPFMLPPGTPKDRVQTLRKAFEATLKDKEFLADTDKAKMTTAPVTSGELEKVVQGIFDLDPVMVEKLKEILFK